MKTINRRKFIQNTGLLTASGLLAPSFGYGHKKQKSRVVLVGTGGRGIGMWGAPVQEEYNDILEFVGLCDINPGRVAYAKKKMKVDCPVYTDFDKMMKETKPDTLIVTTTDATHHEYIVKGLEAGLRVISEKPMTTDEFKCQEIFDAEKRTGNKVIVTFNMRYSSYVQQIWELLRNGEVGDIKSVDLNWYLDTSHGASYFRRWHGEKEHGGTLLVHKATHHYDVLNYWMDSEPEEVFAYGSLDYYGQKNSKFNSTNCRPCPHKSKCNFYWDITESQSSMDLYVANEKHDGYLRDGCIYRKEIDIYDTMAVQYKYANGVKVNYSLTACSPYEGYRLAVNGTKGRLDAWIKSSMPTGVPPYQEITIRNLFGNVKNIKVMPESGGHGGSDPRLKDKIFRYPDAPDLYKQSAGSRDGAMSALIGIAARNSIETGKIVRIEDLTSLVPVAKKS
ncbi:Gfo/Idh/MocA family oxidoreductase [Cyclobacterium sp. 1_MG-2023]|uniref:Gfo/Idh/MocA family protein n=1 Tax=Cyclobacterium sp. 1_MG-2023 TaxID=3062681 RepID=UPI0026E409B5|nr:Gfo/Idh/MocA family oxidoreductase [Cyclobacterium sp. 1_MG-2023]MDO6438553.1 Gfo/Idh/MocA family oxidoreductase [Cyclobacterium sp. 1_MG-2023]